MVLSSAMSKYTKSRVGTLTWPDPHEATRSCVFTASGVKCAINYVLLYVVNLTHNLQIVLPASGFSSSGAIQREGAEGTVKPKSPQVLI